MTSFYMIRSISNSWYVTEFALTAVICEVEEMKPTSVVPNLEVTRINTKSPKFS